jgi:hypothetical protein
MLEMGVVFAVKIWVSFGQFSLKTPSKLRFEGDLREKRSHTPIGLFLVTFEGVLSQNV